MDGIGAKVVSRMSTKEAALAGLAAGLASGLASSVLVWLVGYSLLVVPRVEQSENTALRVVEELHKSHAEIIEILAKRSAKADEQIEALQREVLRSR